MKPILFNTEMVKGLLSGHKTVTRRVMKPQPIWSSCGMRWNWKNVGWWRDGWNPIETITWKNAVYQPGDILYVRETFFKTNRGHYYYKADGKHEALDAMISGSFFKWRSPATMPKEAARLFLRVTNVRVERLQDITDEDLVRDFGFDQNAIEVVGRYDLAKPFWDSIIKPKDRHFYGWDANPWVWVIEFERISKEEAINESKN